MKRLLCGLCLVIAGCASNGVDRFVENWHGNAAVSGNSPRLEILWVVKTGLEINLIGVSAQAQGEAESRPADELAGITESISDEPN